MNYILPLLLKYIAFNFCLWHVFCCRTGYEKAGLVCLLHSVFDRLKEKEDLNILQTVKHMKERNPGLITEYVSHFPK